MRGKKLPVIVLAVLSLVLSGCTVAQGFGLGRDKVPKDALCPGKERVDDITVVDWWQPIATPAVLESAQRFNCKYPHIAINISIAPNIGDDSNGKLLAAVSAGEPPDMVLSWGGDVLPSWAVKGEIQPIDDLAKEFGFREEDFVDYAWRSAHWDDQQYGIPVDWDPDAMLWYNRDVFKDAGLDPNKPPETWEQLQQYAEKIDKIDGGKIKRLGFIPFTGWGFNWAQLGHLFGAEFKVGTEPEIQVDSPGLRKSMQYVYDTAKKYGGAAKVNSFLSIAGAQGAAADPLLSGRVGMMLTGDWQIGQQNNVGADVFNKKLGVVPMPTPPGGTPYLCHSGWSFMFPRDAENVREAMQFVQWVMEPDNFAKHIGTAIGWLPAKKEIRSHEYLTSNPAWRAVLEIDKKMGQKWWLPPSPILQQYYRILDQTNASIIALETDPISAIEKAQEDAELVLKNAIALGIYDEGGG